MKIFLLLFAVVFSLMLSISNQLFAQEPGFIHLAGGTAAFDAGQNGKIYVTSIPSVMVSADQGTSWQNFFNGVIADDITLADGNIFVAGMSSNQWERFNGRIVRSNTNGSSWDTLYTSGTPNSHCAKIAVFGRLMAAILETPDQADSIIFSNDAGQSWRTLIIPADDGFPRSNLVDVDFLGTKLIITDVDGLIIYDNCWSYVSTGVKAKSTCISGNSIMVAGSKDGRAAISTYTKGTVSIDAFGGPLSAAYSVATGNGQTFAIVSGQDGPSLQCKEGNGSWGVIATYSFQIKSCKVVGSKLYVYGPREIVIYNMTVSGVPNQGQGQSIPDQYGVKQNFPNPFNPTTRIGYLMKADAFVSIKVFDGAGKEVAVLVNEFKSYGHYTVEFDASNLPSGVYYYTFTAAGITATKKMMLVK